MFLRRATLRNNIFVRAIKFSNLLNRHFQYFNFAVKWLLALSDIFATGLAQLDFFLRVGFLDFTLNVPTDTPL